MDAPLGTYLPDYPTRAIAQQVTIHHLLTHTGGTGDIFGPDFDAHRLTLKTLGDYVTLYGSRNPAFAPGARWEYSNYGFVLLGRVIEAVSGQTYYDFVREHVFFPAGMTATGFEPEDVEVPGRAQGYMRSGTAWVSNRETLPYRGTSAGGGYSTVGDLVRFLVALLDNRLLNAKYTALLTTGKTKALGSDYAYGFRDVTENGVRRIGHSGGAPGMSGDLRIFPDDAYVIVVLANIDSAATRVASWITERLPLPAR